VGRSHRLASVVLRGPRAQQRTLAAAGRRVALDHR
jgi:hypothetical protein